MPIFMSNEAIKAYLLAHVEKRPDGCRIWKRRVDNRDYGIIFVNGRNQRAARLAYEIFGGPIPPGHDIHHTCGCRRCVNPAHLKPMPRGEHLRLHSQSGSWAGSRNSQAKLTEADAQFIKAAGPFFSCKTLAEQFDVSERTIYNILSGGGWKHVEPLDIPRRTREEALEAHKKMFERVLSDLMEIRAECQEIGEPEPPSMDYAIRQVQRACSLSSMQL